MFDVLLPVLILLHRVLLNITFVLFVKVSLAISLYINAYSASRSLKNKDADNKTILIGRTIANGPTGIVLANC